MKCVSCTHRLVCKWSEAISLFNADSGHRIGEITKCDYYKRGVRMP